VSIKPRHFVSQLIDRHVQDWQHAYDLCCASAKDCAEHLVWTPVAKFALEGAVRSHRALGLDKTREEWVMLASAYMRICALSPKDQEMPELEWVINALSDCAGLDDGE
jgi:hypothetical protein